MSVTTGEDSAEDRRRQLALLTELREVEHWCRLVAARIDLAVAAVVAVDEPVARSLPAAARAVPFGLRELVGLAPPGHVRGEVKALLRLRAVQRDLDAHARALRARTRVATQDLLTRLDDPAYLLPREPDDEGKAPVILLEARRRRRPDPDGVA